VSRESAIEKRPVPARSIYDHKRVFLQLVPLDRFELGERMIFPHGENEWVIDEWLEGKIWV
jgi:hypothetical protein